MGGDTDTGEARRGKERQDTRGGKGRRDKMQEG